jgi:2-polyprenyl-6-methoxyphenol hydroxylase-like FAD-dependent oxidoreductase
MNIEGVSQEHAIVIGGGFAGLLAARAVAAHYRGVTIVERDTLPSVPEQRRGAPQGRHAHGILASGRRTLEQLFPGIAEQLLESGALNMDAVRDARWFLQGACLSRPTSGLDALLLSRPLLECTVRRRVLQLRNVHVVQNRTAEELVMSPDRRRVIGIKVAQQYMPADLVVDASGRGSHTPEWLAELGYPEPPEERIEIKLGYATRWFRRQPGHLNGDLAAVIPPTPESKRGGVMLAQEGDRWIVTLIAHFRNYPPADLADFVEFTRTLPAPFIYDVVRNAEPLGDAALARFPASVWRRYDKLRRFPDGYLVFGDAISSFNPRYGQGMSVAALQAVELMSVLSRPSPNLAQRFFAKAAKVVEIPWTIAASNDFRMKEVQGPRTVRAELINWYIARLQRAAHKDPELALAFHRVANLLAAPPSILRPDIALRVLRGNLPRFDWLFGRDLHGREANLQQE